MRHLSLLTLLLLPACSPERSLPQGPAQRVIVISCDTLRADRLGCYGYPLPTSPTLDALARESTLYRSAWTTAPWTAPAMAALMTGRTPDELGVHGGNRFALAPEALTLAEEARDAGFATAAVVSNWVLRQPPAGMGSSGLSQGFDVYDDEMKQREGNREAFERHADATSDAAIRWLDSSAARDGRFFLWIHYQDPHGPYTPPAEFAQRFKREDTLRVELPTGKTQSGKGQIPAYQVVGGERSLESYRARYDAEVAWFDHQLARLFTCLREKNWWEDTLLVFTADHGESLGENGWFFCHGENLQRETVQVPLIIRFPGRSSRMMDVPVSHLDLWPTIREALGLESAARETADPSSPARRGLSLFTPELPLQRPLPLQLGTPGTARRHVGMVDGDWIFTVFPDGRTEYTPLRELGQPQLPELQAKLRQAQQPDGGPRLPVLPLVGDGRSRQALQNLGYTEGEDH